MTAPTCVVNARSTTATKTAPCPLVFECYSGSTFQGSKQKHIARWRLKSGPGSGVSFETFTDPVTGATRYFQSGGQDGSGSIGAIWSDVYGWVYSFVAEVAGTYTAECQLRIDGEAGTGEASVVVAARADAKHYRVGSGGSDSSPTGTGTAADKLYYRTLGAAVTAFSGNDNTVWLDADETHNVTATLSLTGHNNTVFRKLGAGADPVVAMTTANTTLVNAQSAENTVSMDITWRIDQALSGASGALFNLGTADDFIVLRGAIGQQSSISGNGPGQAVAFVATPHPAGIALIGVALGFTRSQTVLGNCDDFFWLGGSIKASINEHSARFLQDGDADTGTQRATIAYVDGDFTGGAAGKGCLRLQHGLGFYLHHCKFLSGVSDLMGFDGFNAQVGRLDGCWVGNSTASTASPLRYLQNGEEVFVVNTIIDDATGTTGNGAFSKVDAGDFPGGPPANRANVSFAHFLVRCTNGNGHLNVASLGTNDWQVTDMTFRMGVFAVNSVASWTRRAVLNLYTPKQPGFLVDRCQFPAVGAAYTLGRVNDGLGNVSYTASQLFARADFTNCSLTAGLTGDFSLAGGWRHEASAETGPTVAGTYHDIHLNVRGATSRKGPADAQPAGSPAGTIKSRRSVRVGGLHIAVA